MATSSPRPSDKRPSATSPPKPVRPRRDFKAMEERRMRAADRFAAGVRQVDVARELGVSHQTVSDWHALWKQGGKDALRGPGRAGRRPKLSPEQLVDVE